MSYPHFGYTYPSAASSMTSSQLLMSAASSAAHTSIATSCCETGRPIMTDPQTGQTICSCGQYSSTAGLLTYPRVAGLTDGVYTASAYAHATQAGLVPFGTDPSAFYPTLNTTYDLKDNAEAWRGLTQPCYPYDPTMAGYPYGAGYGMDIGVGNRRKNATRETTSTLKAWLYEHRKNPYPTKGEKIMLAIITKMTLTQVSTWFANARRRLKKENKMTWSPRNRCGDGRDKMDSDAEDDDNDLGENSNGSIKNDDDKKDEDDDDDVKDINETGSDVLSIGDGPDLVSAKLLARSDTSSPPLGPVSTVTSAHPGPSSQPLQPQGRRPSPISHIMHPTPIRSTSTDTSPTTNTCSNNSSSASGHLNPQKPRIWSLAHTATSSSPPPLGSRRSPPNLPAVVSVGAGQSSYPNSMNSVRQWIEGAYPVSVSHSVGLSHAYALAARSMAGAGATMTTPSSHHHQHVQDTPPNTPPIIPRFPITSLSVQSSLGLAARDLALHNGIGDKLSGESRGLGDIKPDLKSVDPDDQTKTAFKPVTKSKFDEIVKV